jgi:hypothetical protein
LSNIRFHVVVPQEGFAREVEEVAFHAQAGRKKKMGNRMPPLFSSLAMPDRTTTVMT